jgi:hypothetical protein
MSKPTSRTRYLRPPRILPSPPVSVAQQRTRNRATVASSLLTLHCRSRGCRERIADLELDTSRSDRGPTVLLAVHAPWIREPAPADVLTRIRLTGAFDPETSPVYVEFTHWRPGSRVEIVCRQGHESAIGIGALCAAARRANVSAEAGNPADEHAVEPPL